MPKFLDAPSWYDETGELVSHSLYRHSIRLVQSRNSSVVQFLFADQSTTTTSRALNFYLYLLTSSPTPYSTFSAIMDDWKGAYGLAPLMAVGTYHYLNSSQGTSFEVVIPAMFYYNSASTLFLWGGIGALGTFGCTTFYYNAIISDPSFTVTDTVVSW